MLGAVGDQGGGVAAQLLVHQVHLVAVDQPQELLPRHVEGERDGVRDPHDAAALFGHHRVEDLGAVVDQHVHQPLVGGLHPLGAAGGAGGEDDVGQVVGPMPDGRAGHREVHPPQIRAGGRVVQVQPSAVALGLVGQVFGGAGGGDGDQGRGVGDHVAEPRGRVLQVQGDVGGAELEDGEQRHHPVGGAVQGDRDPGLGPHAQVGEQAGQAFGALVQFREGEALLPGHQGDALGVPGRGGLEERGRGGVGQGEPPSLAQGEAGPSGPGVERVEGGDRGVGAVGDPFEQPRHPVVQFAGGLGGDHVGAVGEAEPELVAGLDDEGQRIVGGVVAGDRLQAGAFAHVPVAFVVSRDVALDVEGVEETPTADGALDVGQPHVVVGQQVGLLPLDPDQQVADGLGGSYPDPDRHGVEEDADDGVDPVDLGRATRDGAAEDDVVAAGVGAQGQPPGREEEGVGGDAEFPGQSGEPVGQSGVDDPVDGARHDRGVAALPCGDQGALVHAVEGGAPGLHRAPAVLTGEPHQVVAVGAGFGQIRVVSAAQVQVHQLGVVELSRPAVHDDVVEGQQEDVPPLGQVDQHVPDQGRTGQVEAAFALGDPQMVQAAARLDHGQVGQVGLVPGRRDPLGDELDRTFDPLVHEAGAQGRVASQECVGGGPQGGGVDAAGELEDVLDGVDVQVHLVLDGVEQQPLLEGGEREHVLDPPRTLGAGVHGVLLGR